LTAPPDRSPPQSPDAEEHVLACCLIDGSDTIARCLEARLTPEAFYTPANRLLFEVILDVYQKRPPVSLEVLAEELKTRRQLEAVGGYPHLLQVTGKIPTTAHVGYFIEKVREKHLLRELIKAATGAVEQCYGFTGGLEEFVDKVESDLFRVTQDRVSDAAQPMKDTVKEANAVIAKLKERSGELTGVATGFLDLDRMTFGLQRGEMIVLAARPSVGKTALALNIADHAAIPRKASLAPTTTLIFSLEMTAAALAMRMLCSRSDVRFGRIRDGATDNEDMDKLARASRELAAAPLFIDDSASLSIMEIRAKARRLHSRQPLGLIVIDYLQLISPTKTDIPREQQVAEASRGIKALAKELDVPVLVLSQLNRSMEKDERQPRLSDLRESGSIEQDADVVLMLYRPPPPKDRPDDSQDEPVKVHDLIVAKQRNGPVGQFKLTFQRDLTRFENYTQ
jgi:replicative DNA helicase